MKILYKGFIYESKQKPEIWYHGTSSKNISSILKKGMLANNDKKVYSEPQDNLNINILSTKSLTGSYWAKSISDASFAASRSVDKFGVKAIIISQLIANSIYGDEDKYTSKIKQSISDVASFLNISPDMNYMYCSLIAYIMVNDSSKISKTFGDILNKKLSNNKNKPIPYNIMEELFINFIKRGFYHVDSYYHSYYKKQYSYYTEDLGKQVDYDSIEIPKVNKNIEDNVLKSIEKLTKYYKEFANNDTMFTSTGRIKSDVKYSGNNKILAIIVLGKLSSDGYHVVYGKVPEESKEQLKRVLGYVNEN